MWHSKVRGASKDDKNCKAGNSITKFPRQHPVYRAFAIEIFDTNEEEVMHLFRQHACACCNCCCMPVMTVEAPPATVIGHVKQIRAKCRKILHVECPVGTHVATIKCPPFCCKCRFRDVPFTIMDAQGERKSGVGSTPDWRRQRE